jgi:hypothetical protein
MTKGPCLCGDTECPWCGSAQGTYTGSESVQEPTGDCDICGASLIDQDDLFTCDKCLAEVKASIAERF